MLIQTKRIYDEPNDQDGMRVLVDRLWPRGIRKDQLKIDLWLKEVAPSHALRQWFHHELPNWPEFERRFKAELDENHAIEQLQELVNNGPVTLLFSAKDRQYNNAVALKKYLEGSL